MSISGASKKRSRVLLTLGILALVGISTSASAQENGFGMGPPTTPAVVAAADAGVKKPMPAGPFQPNWRSIQANYAVPQWLVDAKFGLFLHWGVYAVPAYHNEWYEKHMYGAFSDWHRAHFGPQDVFGYKDFISKFTCEKFDPDQWAALFKESGARFVVPTAQHHDNFALWDSNVTHIDAKEMGPHRDLIGELARAVRKQGLKFGISNHGIENFTFINPPAALAAELKAKQVDLYDPKWNDIYHVADRSDAANQAFLTDWVNRNLELIDKYQPDLLWFDNGVNHRFYDPLKTHVAAYYYNRAKAWGKEVSISTKSSAYAPSNNDRQQVGSVIDFEKIGSRSPADIRTGVWQVDEPIGSTWGYTKDMRVQGPGTIVAKLADTVSKNGTLLLNLSPMADGTIPQAQQETLREVGKWLRTNGEAIYGTHNWVRFGETIPVQGQRDRTIRFTVKGETLYALFPRGLSRSGNLCYSLTGDKDSAQWRHPNRHSARRSGRSPVHAGRGRSESHSSPYGTEPLCLYAQNYGLENERADGDSIGQSSVV